MQGKEEDGNGTYLEQNQNMESNLEQIKQEQQSDQIQQDKDKQQCSISYKMINQVKQEDESNAIAFNNSGSIIATGSKNDIKIWSFENEQMSLLNVLKGHEAYINCLLFSKKYQWLISCDDNGPIKCWKQGDDENWLSNQVENKHQDGVKCTIFTQNEDHLLTCSRDKTIIVWKVQYETNSLEFLYSLENKHNGPVEGLSLNQSENTLVSCGSDNLLISWIKGDNEQWIYQTSKKFYSCLSRVCFINENQILLQQDGQGFTNIFQIENEKFEEQLDLKISLNNPEENYDCCLFPTIYNQSKNVIIQKSHKFVYIIRKQSNGLFKVDAQPIDCECRENFGTLSGNGEYLIIWNGKTKEFLIYKISYGS